MAPTGAAAITFGYPRNLQPEANFERMASSFVRPPAASAAPTISIDKIDTMKHKQCIAASVRSECERPRPHNRTPCSNSAPHVAARCQVRRLA